MFRNDFFHRLLFIRPGSLLSMQGLEAPFTESYILRLDAFDDVFLSYLSYIKINQSRYFKVSPCKNPLNSLYRLRYCKVETVNCSLKSTDFKCITLLCLVKHGMG